MKKMPCLGFHNYMKVSYNKRTETIKKIKNTEWMYMYFKKGTKKETFQTFVGSGHSSSKSVITAGPRGSSRGIDTTKDSTTCSQPSSDSATRWSVSIACGGPCSLSNKPLRVRANQIILHIYITLTNYMYTCSFV